MKKLSFMIAAAGLLATLALNSCKKEEVKETTTKGAKKSGAIYKTAQEEEDYYDNIIKTVSYGLVDLVGTQSFRQTVSNQVALKFDLDDNVLLKTLDSVLASQGTNLKQEMITALNIQGKQNLVQYVDAAVNGFEYFGGTKYTQIYVPFIENKDIITTTPKICLNYNDEDILNAIKREGSNVTESTVDETFATANNVYVISVNESVNDLGKINDYVPFDPNGNPGLLNPDWVGARSLFVQEINISDRKEGWGNGRSDISFIAITTKFACNRQPDASGQPFGKLAKADLNKWFTPTFGNKTIADGISTLWERRDFEDMGIVFYEQDVRGKFGRSFAPYYCPYTKGYYNSKETPYGEFYPDQTSFGGTGNTKIYPLTGGQFMLYGKRLY